MKISYLSFLLIILVSLNSCKKNKNQEDNNNCISSIPSYQDTIIVDSKSYFIIVSSNQQTAIIELIGFTGQPGVDLSVNFLQLQNNSNCFESNVFSIYSGVDSKVYKFDNVPTWTTDTLTSASIKLTINSNVYYLHDSKINK